MGYPNHVELFVPDAESWDTPEERWAEEKTRGEKVLGQTFTDRKIFAANFEHDGYPFRAEVGQVEPENRDGIVIAIFEVKDGNGLCMCRTATRNGMTTRFLGKPSCIHDFAETEVAAGND